jgi:hypothetical protein
VGRLYLAYNVERVYKGRGIWMTAAWLDILRALPRNAQLNVESSSVRSEERPGCPRGFLLSIGGTGK